MVVIMKILDDRRWIQLRGQCVVFIRTGYVANLIL